VALLEQHVDIGPGLGDGMLHLHQPVVDHHAIHDGDDDETQYDQRHDTHDFLSVGQSAAILKWNFIKLPDTVDRGFEPW
jgi:hypothetical protein